jgi:hypothetical protein
MTEITTTRTAPAYQADAGPVIPIHPSDVLMNLIVTLLAPMFIGAAGGDIGFARMAAIETVNAYRTRNPADLISIALIIAYGLAALGSLSLSMADNLSLAMTLRLRGNASALTRSAELNRCALEKTREGNATSHHLANEPESRTAATADDDLDEAALLAGVTAVRKLAAETTAQLRAENQAMPIARTEVPAARGPGNQTLWANAMLKEAENLCADLNNLPPEERRQASFRVATLTTTASGLLAAVAAVPLNAAIGPAGMPPVSV